MKHLNVFEKEYNQEFVDDLVVQAQKKAERCDNEAIAISLLKDIQQLVFLSKAFYVPDIIYGWEEMALSYVESQDGVFKLVYFPKMSEIYSRGIEALKDLEQHVLAESLSEVILFNLAYNFNLDVENFNQYCKQYNHELFKPFIMQDHMLYSKYKSFIGEIEDE